MRFLVSLIGLALLTGAAVATADADEPRARAAAGDTLQLSGTVIDKSDMVNDSAWTVSESGAIYDTPGFRGEYTWSIPASIPPAGAGATLNVTATDKSGGRFFGKLGVSNSALFIEGGPAEAEALADKNGGAATATGSASFKLVPGSYCDTCTPSLTVGVQDGPKITFQYKVVPAAPAAKPCPGGRIAGIAQSTGPLICFTDEPAPGQTTRVSSPTLGAKDKSVTVGVGSSAGNLNGTTIVGDAEAARRQKIGEAVAACFLIGPAEAFAYSKVTFQTAFELLKAEHILNVEDINNLGHAPTRLKICILLATALAEVDKPTTSAAAAGCAAKRVALSPRVRRGRVVGLKLAARQKASRSSVRYRCASGPGGTLKITAKRRKPLRKAVGKKLDLGIVREPDAPARQATLTFGFF